MKVTVGKTFDFSPMAKSRTFEEGQEFFNYQNSVNEFVVQALQGRLSIGQNIDAELRENVPVTNMKPFPLATQKGRTPVAVTVARVRQASNLTPMQIPFLFPPKWAPKGTGIEVVVKFDDPLYVTETRLDFLIIYS